MHRFVLVLSTSAFVGCGTAASGGGGGSTGEGVAPSTGEVNTTQSSEAQGSSGGATSTGEFGSSGDSSSDDGSGSSTVGGSSSSSDDTDTDTDGSGWGRTECTETNCSVACFRTYTTQDEWGECGCDSGVTPEGLVPDCGLESRCPPLPGGQECISQGLRYNIPGRYRVSFGDGEDYGEVEYEVFGPGQVRARTSSTEHGCCEGNASVYEGYYFPQSTIPADDEFWETCAPSPWGTNSCFMPNSIFDAVACEPMLAACPEPAPLPKTCEESCPMAGDGICDESTGTGLCADGCDPSDCG